MPGVLANDVDVDDSVLFAQLVDGPAHGTLTLNEDGSFRYTPAANYAGPDGFSYAARDATGALSAPTAVRLEVREVNDAPVITSTPPLVVDIGGQEQRGGDSVLYVPDAMKLEFKWDKAKAAFRNELGVYRVDDASGRVQGLLPGDPGYAAAALAAGNIQIIFKHGDKQGAKSKLTLAAGHYAFFLVQNGRAADVVRKNPENDQDGTPMAFFSLAQANPSAFDHLHASLRDATLQLAWEDQTSGGDRDFDDAVISARLPQHCNAVFVEPAEQVIALTQLAAGVKGDRVFQAPGAHGTQLEAVFTFGPRNATYHNEAGIYRVDDASGRIGNLLPGASGYAEAALARSQVLFSPHAKPGDEQRLTLEGGAYYGFYIIENGSRGDVLARNPSNSLYRRPLVYFSFEQANPDCFDHLRMRVKDGRLQLEWEDTVRGGDRDFDDVRIGMTLHKPAAVAGFSYQAAAVDPDGDTLRWSLLAGPAGATIDAATGRLTWKAGGPGRYDFAIRVEDGRGGAAEQRFTLEVRATALPPVFDWGKPCRFDDDWWRCGDDDERKDKRWRKDFVCETGRDERERDPNCNLRVKLSAGGGRPAEGCERR
jgi:VCBS repeat-containing protein